MFFFGCCYVNIFAMIKYRAGLNSTVCFGKFSNPKATYAYSGMLPKKYMFLLVLVTRFAS